MPFAIVASGSGGGGGTTAVSDIVTMVLDKSVALGTGASVGNVEVPVPDAMDGKTITAVSVALSPLGTPSSSGGVTFNLVRTRAGVAVDVTSSVMTIAQGDFISSAGVINTSNDDLASGDFISLDCEDDGTGVTGPLWVMVTIA